MPQNIVVLTANKRKFEEVQIALKRYGVRAVQASASGLSDDDIKALLTQDKNNIAVIREASKLHGSESQRLISQPHSPENHLRSVDNIGYLKVFTLTEEEELDCYQDTMTMQGYIDLSDYKKDDNVFDWDNVFRLQATGMTYEEMRLKGLKNSVRNNLLSKWIVEKLHYAALSDYNFDPRNVPAQPIDFSLSVADYLQNNDYSTDLISRENDPLANVMRGILNDGVFFRAPQNRRQKNYWLPGQNAGIPRTPKKDALHELTFTMHDLFHHMQPILDLVFTGTPQSMTTMAENIYCVHRMCGEAFTMVMADMLFIDELAQQGVEYDYTKRHIHPLYKQLDLPHEGTIAQRLRPLFYANVSYALKGDDSAYRALKRDDIPDEEFEATLTAFKGKYEGYFRADWQWTKANFACMAERAEIFNNWHKFLGDALFHKAGLTTIDSFVDELTQDKTANFTTLDGVVDAVFDNIYNKISLQFDHPVTLQDEVTLRSNAFTRYMIGQSMLFSVLDHIPQTKSFGRASLYQIRNQSQWSYDDIVDMRKKYNEHLRYLTSQGIINADDYHTWSGTFPVFEPNYVYYESKKTHASLDQIARDCFITPDTHKELIKTIDGVKFLDQAKLWNNLRDVPLERRTAAIIRAAGGESFDEEGYFIRRAGMGIINIGGFPYADNKADCAIPLNNADDLQNVRHQLQTAMGGAASWCYMNPASKPLNEMFDVVAANSEFSVAHTSSLTVLIAGASSLVENEFNSQRDIVHLARLTEARTKAQSDPSMLVLYPELLPHYQELREATKKIRAHAQTEMNSGDASALPARDKLEGLNAMYSGHKVTAFALTASLRNFQKLVSGLSDGGKEEEYRRLLFDLNDILHNFMPALFKPSQDYGFTMPAHLQGDKPQSKHRAARITRNDPQSKI
jgi:hypothetical protein